MDFMYKNVTNEIVEIILDGSFRFKNTLIKNALKKYVCIREIFVIHFFLLQAIYNFKILYNFNQILVIEGLI